jgi:predicted dehydrogenase
VVFTVNNWKYAPIWLKATELIRSGEIGKVHSVDLNVLRLPNSGGGHTNWRTSKQIAGGGILIDHGWHNLYLIMAMINEPPVSIAANMKSGADPSSELEETVDVRLEFPEAWATLHLTWQADCRRNFGTIVGDKGTLSVNDDHLILKPKDGPPTRHDFPQALSAGSHHTEWMEPVVAEFAREISHKNGHSDNLSEAQWCAQMIHLAYLSHEEGARVIPVEPLSSHASVP